MIRLADYEKPKKADRATYDDDLRALQYELQLVQAAYITQGLKGIVAVEGWDAGGKGGLIKRMTAELDPRYTKVWPIGAPTREELAHHFLWRFWQRLPGSKEIAVFDRSWYGRVLVERVDRLTPEAVWRTGYDTIAAFEADQVADGARLVKVFLHITQDEQDKQFRERLETPHKRWKTGREDYHNRSMRSAYVEAYEEMFARSPLPWVVIAGDDKKAARLAGLRAVIDGLSAGVDLSFPEIDPELRRVAEAAIGPLNPASTSAGTTTGD